MQPSIRTVAARLMATAVISSAGLAMAGSGNNSSATGNSGTDARIDEQLANVGNEALMAKDMTGVISLFDQSSQQHIRESSTFSENYGRELDAQIQQLSKNWQGKYGHSFVVKSSGTTFGSSFASVDTGSPSRDSRLASAVERDGGLSAQATGNAEAVAVANVHAARNLPAVEVPLVCEKGADWKLAAPGSLSASRLRQNLLAQVTTINDQRATWPASEMDAERMVTHRVLIAIFDRSLADNHAAAAPAVAVSKPLPTQTAKPAAVTTSTGNAGHWWQFWRW
ncbi:MAG TPA: hypothetical protein VGG19_15530 [Tepidisphaeraceae bacterium]